MVFLHCGHFPSRRLRRGCNISPFSIINERERMSTIFKYNVFLNDKNESALDSEVKQAFHISS